MKKIIILVVFVLALAMALTGCQQPREMELEEVNITQGLDGELSVQFPLHYDDMKINISIDDGDTWYEFDDNSIIFTYDKETDTLSNESGLTLSAPQDYTFKAKYVSFNKDYLDSDVISKSIRVKKPQYFSGDEVGAPDYYHSIIRSEKYFTGMYEDDGVYEFEKTRYNSEVTYKRCVVVDFEVTENGTSIKLKNFQDGQLIYNDDLEMRLYASSDSLYEGLSEWLTSSEENSITYNLHADYDVRLLVRLKETNDYLASDNLLAVLTDDGIRNENILFVYRKLISNEWTTNYVDINYTQEDIKDNVINRGVYRQNIIDELEDNSIHVELGNILSCTKEVGDDELRGYIFEFYSFEDALAFYNYKNSGEKNVAIDGKYVAEVRKFDGREVSSEELACDDTTFFDVIEFSQE